MYLNLFSQVEAIISHKNELIGSDFLIQMMRERLHISQGLSFKRSSSLSFLNSA